MKDPDRVRVVPAERSAAQLDRFAARLASVARQIARAAATDEWAYSPQGWWCGEGSCPAFAACPAGGMP